MSQLDPTHNLVQQTVKRTREQAAKQVESWMAVTNDRAIKSLIQRIANEVRNGPPDTPKPQSN